MKKSTLILITLVILLGIAGSFLPNALTGGPDKNDILYIRVSGAVKSPGIYSMPVNSTIEELIQKAGGALPDADLSNISLQKKLQKAQPLFIPSK